MEMAERFAGCLLGGACGDMVGAPVEFMSRAAMAGTFGPDGVTVPVPAYGRTGSVTDDTQMTLFVSEGLRFAAAKGWSERSAQVEGGEALGRWLSTQGSGKPAANDSGLISEHLLWARRAPGNTCVSSIAGKDGGDCSEPARNNSKGCGAVMRMAPAGLFGAAAGFSNEEVFGLGCRLGALTHGHRDGWLSAGAFAVMVRELALGSSMMDAATAAYGQLAGVSGGGCGTQALLVRAMELSKAGRPGPGMPLPSELGEGWVGDEALAIGVYCALVAAGFEDGVLLAVNIDGDSDSTGAIAGNLLGCLNGAGAIPSGWLDVVEVGGLAVSEAKGLMEAGKLVGAPLVGAADASVAAAWLAGDVVEQGPVARALKRLRGF